MTTLTQIVDGQAPADPVLHKNPMLAPVIRAASSGIGDSELRNKLQEALKEKYGSGKSCDSCAPSTGGGWIDDVYSRESYFVYSSDGKKFRHDYTIRKGEVELVGNPQKVRMAYVAAGGQGSGCQGPNCGRKGGGGTKPDSSTGKGRGNAVREVAKAAGYKVGTFKDKGQGTAAGQALTMQHPDGHQLEIGTGPGPMDKYWEHTHSDGTKTVGGLHEVGRLVDTLKKEGDKASRDPGNVTPMMKQSPTPKNWP